MNGPGDIPLTHNSSTLQSEACHLISIIPTLGMSSCRGRAEAFARRLSSKLRTLGSQTDNEIISPEDEPIINGGSVNTWVTASNESDHTITNHQSLRHESDSFFDFDCELESPGSPVDECEYLRLVETTSNTPHNSAPESGYAFASVASSHSSTDGPYFDASNKIPLNCIESRLIKQPLEAIGISDVASTKNALSLDSIHSNDKSYKNCTCNGVSSNQCNENALSSINVNSWSGDVSQNYIKTDKNENLKIESNINNIILLESTFYKEGALSVQDEIIKELHRESQEISLSGNNHHSIHEEKNCALEAIRKDHNNRNKKPKTVLAEIFEKTSSLKDISNGHSEVVKEALIMNIPSILQNDMSEEIDSNGLTQIFERNEEKAINLCTQEKFRLSAVDITDDEDDCRPQRVRRCSSLKTGKTPPGTPGRKKIVRFADVLGLDLADIKTFLDEIPTIPKSAFEDLEVSDSEAPIQMGPKSDKLLMPLFQQPGGLSTFLDLVREKQVSLENAAVTDHINQTIIGSVRVRNLDFHKSVHIRYTLDNWRSFADLQTNYVENSCDGFSDKFTFTLFGNSLQIGQRLEFAVRFQCKGQQYWDNNYGTNYCFQCLPISNPATNPIQSIVPSHHINLLTGLLSPTAGDAWCSSFY